LSIGSQQLADNLYSEIDRYSMASANPSPLVAYEGDTGFMGFTSTSPGFFMLGSGPNLNNVSAGSETDAQRRFSINH